MNTTFVSAACLTGAMLAGAGQAAAQDAPPAPEPAPATAEPAPAPPHTVARGESLWIISTARLGTAERWVEIFTVNQDVLQNPNQIEAGQVLKIPATPVAVPPEVLAGLAGPSATSSSSGSSSEPTATSRSGAAQPSNSGGGGAGGDLASIRQCESGGNYGAVSAGGTYRGAYQFDQQTWESVGGSGDPAAASPGEQDARAQALRGQRGSSPWPNCG